MKRQSWEEIKKWPTSKQNKYLDSVQKEILKKHYGDIKRAVSYKMAVVGLIPIAFRSAKRADLGNVKLEKWQTISCGDRDTFNSDKRSVFFHREMTRLKRDAGLIA